MSMMKKMWIIQTGKARSRIGYKLQFSKIIENKSNNEREYRGNKREMDLQSVKFSLETLNYV